MSKNHKPAVKIFGRTPTHFKLSQVVSNSGEPMVSRRVLVILCASCLVFSLAAGADPWKDESGHGRHGEKHHKHKHRHKHRNKHAEYGPPPWAPAHGYRGKHYDHDYEEEPAQVRYESPQVEFVLASQKIGIDTGNCNREAVGAVMGGVIGGVIGNQAAGRDKRTIGTIAGSLIGLVVGKEIGRSMDNADAQCTNQALERAPDGQAITWDNPNTGHRYSVTPYETYRQDDGRYCRKYRAAVNAGSNTKYYGETACRTVDGVWERLPPS
jgi:surface antigen